MNVYLAADHAGFSHKEAVMQFLIDEGHAVTDCGAFSFEPGDDYPDYITPCAQKVSEDAGSYGVVFGGSGQGEAIAANRIRGVRAVVYYAEASHPQEDASGNSLSILESVRTHNDANILSLGARFLTVEEAKRAVHIFLTTPFSGGEPHVRRIGKL